MVSKEALLKIKQEVENYVGQEIFVVANLGRNKSVRQKGVIDSAYTNLFVFKDCKTERNCSYSYTDLITNDLQLTLVTGELITDYDFSIPKYTRL